MSENDFTCFYQEHYSSFCFFANRLLNDPQQAEDVVSDVAIKVWEKRESIRHASALKTYFYTSIRNSCITALRSKRKTQDISNVNDESLADDKTILQDIVRAETMQQLHAALEKLPNQCRNVFTKLYVEGKSLSETAADLELSINTIKTHRQRGLKIMRGNISYLLMFSLLLSYTFA